MAVNEKPRVAIFDSIPTPFREPAAAVAMGAGWLPEEFDEVYAAQRRVGFGGIGALISTLGSGETGTIRSFTYSAEPLLQQAGRLRIPVALISDARNAEHYIEKAPASSIVVPPQPPERLNPVLSHWLTGLIEQG